MGWNHYDILVDSHGASQDQAGVFMDNYLATSVLPSVCLYQSTPPSHPGRKKLIGVRICAVQVNFDQYSPESSLLFMGSLKDDHSVAAWTWFDWEQVLEKAGFQHKFRLIIFRDGFR